MFQKYQILRENTKFHLCLGKKSKNRHLAISRAVRKNFLNFLENFLKVLALFQLDIIIGLLLLLLYLIYSKTL